MNIKTFIFDLGNVIVPVEIDRALKYFEDSGSLKGEELRGKALQIAESKLYHRGEISSTDLFEAYKNSLGLRMEFDDFKNAWNSILLPEPILTEDFIQKLSEKYRLLILSDTNEIHFEFIKQNYAVMQYFDDFILSHEVGDEKPSPKMYRAAVEKAECTAAECFFTDDKKANIDGAINFGINAVQFISAGQFENHLKKLDLI